MAVLHPAPRHDICHTPVSVHCNSNEVRNLKVVLCETLGTDNKLSSVVPSIGSCISAFLENIDKGILFVGKKWPCTMYK
jgi:hypothetical protein